MRCPVRDMGRRSQLVIAAVLASAVWAHADDSNAPGPIGAVLVSPVDLLAPLEAQRGETQLGTLERRAVIAVLTARKLTIDPAPEGKPVGTIHVANRQVFAPDDGFLTFFNAFHITTKERVVRREVLLEPGELWSQARADETERKLRDPIFSSLAVVVPVVSASPGHVDILVVTRDVFSLRFNTEFQGQDGYISSLAASVSENNLFGRRKVAALSFAMDQGEWGVGPLYFDRNLASRRLTLRAVGRVLFSREGLLTDGPTRREGSESTISLARPFWNLDAPWAWNIDLAHRVANDRSFLGRALRTYDNPATPEVEALPWLYRYRAATIAAGVSRSMGRTVKHRVKLGYSLEWRRPTLPDDLVADPTLAAAFARDVLPRSERASVVTIGYEMFTPRYVQRRNLASFDVAEDFRLGPTASVSVGVGTPIIGSEKLFARFAARAGYVGDLAGSGLWSVDASLGGRLEGSEASQTWIDNSATVALAATSPQQSWGRVAGSVRAGTLWNETQNRFLSVGGSTGLRGYAINQFSGARRVVMQAEVRSRSIAVWVVRAGFVLFGDLAGAGPSLRALPMHASVGVGARILVPQMTPEVFRLDISVPTEGNFAPRLVFGFGAEF